MRNGFVAPTALDQAMALAAVMRKGFLGHCRLTAAGSKGFKRERAEVCGERNGAAFIRCEAHCHSHILRTQQAYSTIDFEKRAITCTVHLKNCIT